MLKISTLVVWELVLGNNHRHQMSIACHTQQQTLKVCGVRFTHWLACKPVHTVRSRHGYSHILEDQQQQHLQRQKQQWESRESAHVVHSAALQSGRAAQGCHLR